MKYGDLFSGIGCVPQALKKLGIDFEYVFACDIDKHCKNNLLHNFDVETFYDDVNDITELPKVDLFTAGFPCQPFSTVNRKNAGNNHPKHDLFTQAFRCLKLCQPEIFILENVASLTFKNNREYFNYIKSQLDTLNGYNWTYQVMNSKDYGTPQSRNRVWFVGRRDGKPITFPKPCPLTKYAYDIIDPNLDYEYFETKCQPVIDAIAKQENDVIYITNGQTGKFIRFRKWEDSEWIYSLLAGGRIHVCFFNDGNYYRRELTIDELREFQNIDTEFKNICSDSQFRRQIGNGMDVGILSKLLHELLM